MVNPQRLAKVHQDKKSDFREDLDNVQGWQSKKLKKAEDATSSSLPASHISACDPDEK